MTTGTDIVGISGALYALAAFLTSAGSFIGVILTHRKSSRIENRVNGHAERQDSRIEQLASTLAKAGVEVPPPPNGNANA